VHIAVWLVALVATVVAVTAVAKRIDVPAAILLVVVGVAASYVPFIPEIRLNADIVLIGLLPPLLYNAALQTSLLDFNANRRPILLLSVGLVIFTTVGVGLVVHTIVPSVGWPAAFAIGAVVAPPDAVAATAVAKRIGLPHRLVTVLEGESLLNDATALVALRTAIAAISASAATFSVVEVGFDFVRTAVVGVGVGFLVFVAIGWVRKHVTDPVADTSVSIVTPFIAYVVAEELHGSGVLAVVIAGLLLGHKSPVLQTAPSRIAERLNWQTFSFLLENAVFLLIGLQASWILGEVQDSTLDAGTIVWLCAAVLVSVIVLRMMWVFPARYLLIRPREADGRKPPWTFTAVIGWAGMRGVVTLAAAFAIPLEAPHREVLVLVALVVTAGTLLLHGLTLPWVVRVLRVPSPDPREDALARAELLQQATQAGLSRLEEIEPETDEGSVHDILRSRLEQRDFAAWERLGEVQPDGETPSERYARLRLDMLQAERARVLEWRGRLKSPAHVVEDVLAALDVEESMLDRGVDRRQELIDGDRGRVVGRVADFCDDLRDAGTREVPEDRRCVDCVREGSSWVHLRLCLQCGHLGCCDSSPRRHASAHFHDSGHPVVRSAEPGEEWRWCFLHEVVG
jgi:Na+/H+ antiporter